ncbi:polyketide synthase dehydratase domain-containing protein, partial [Streptosporangium sp. NPDC049644]|uniref:polyketide synthase dehydratase domain-containing protein n=1 Tax=Streptosporangium sp. NPDC049644 TaxID=3155507 RepID=UPI0034434C2D
MLEERGVRTKRLRVSHAFHSPLMDPMLEDFRALAGTLTYDQPRIAIVSTLTGEQATAEQLCSPDYWVDQVRGAVRFADGVRVLHARGVRAYLELGPDGVLTAMAQDTLAADPDQPAEDLLTGSDAVLVPVLRRGRDEEPAIMSALAELHVHGVVVDWPAVIPSGRRVELPTYAFQRQRLWPDGAGSRVGNVVAAGLISAGHPLLGAAVGLAGSDGVLLTGRLSLRSHPWLADYAVMGSVVVPGSAFVELAVRAADQVGFDAVEELTLTAPLVLGEDDAVAVQVWVAAGESGRRAVSIYARPVEAADEETWVEYATGVLVSGGPAVAPFDAAVWPPQGASVIELDGLYERLADGGLSYGPVFQGLRAAWRGADGAVFAEAVLPEEVESSAGSFGMHPALLDAALHAVAFAGLSDSDDLVLPFSWGGVCLHAGSASVLRVRLVRTGDDSVSVSAVDAVGAMVFSARSLVLRRVSADQFAVASGGRGVGRDPLFGVEWTPLAELAAAEVSPVAVLGPDRLGVAAAWEAAGGSAQVHADVASLAETGPVPGAVLAEVVSDPVDGVAESAHELTARVLAVAQEWLADDRFADSRLVVVTRGAVAAGDDEVVTDLAAAAVRGLVRSAQSENPGRFVLVDLDDQESSLQALCGVLGSVLASGEPQVAVRGGEVRVARLARVALAEEAV